MTKTPQQIKNEVDKKNINLRLDKLIAVNLMISFIYDGTKCEKCGFIQGTEYKGVKKSYCEHLTQKIDRILKPISEDLSHQAIVFMGDFI